MNSKDVLLQFEGQEMMSPEPEPWKDLPEERPPIFPTVLLPDDCAELVEAFSSSIPVPVDYAACALLGAGNNITDSCCNSYIVDLHPTDNSKYLNLLHGFFGVGGLITPLLITWILNRSGWRASYSVAAVI